MPVVFHLISYFDFYLFKSNIIEIRQKLESTFKV